MGLRGTGFFVSTMLTVVALGCGGGLRAVSSDKVGCAPREITISDDAEHGDEHTWVAECRRRRYYCSGSGSGSATSQVQCWPADTEGQVAQTTLAPPPAPPPQAVPGGATVAGPPAGAAGFLFGWT